MRIHLGKYCGGCEGGEPVIEGEWPRFYAYCSECSRTIAGFDELEYAADYQSSLIDSVYDRMKEEGY